MNADERTSFERHISLCETCSDLVAVVAEEMTTKVESSSDKSLGLVVGEHVGPYVVVEFAGRGSMGEVYRARDPRLERDVAIKLLPSSLARDPELLRRFQIEARAIGGIAHPNTLTVYDLGKHEDTPYLITEWLNGETLRQRLTLGPLPSDQILHIGAEVAQGLAAAHAKGIIHRDIKPSNLFLCNDGSCKILDFGLAQLTSHFSGEEDIRSGPGTLPGTPLGTPGYMSPEQVRGQVIDQRTDLFSLGVVLAEMATGAPVFAGDNPVERMSAVLRDVTPSIGGELGTVISRCLSKEVEERFQSAQDLCFHLTSLRARFDPSISGHRSHKQSLFGTLGKMRRSWLFVTVIVFGLSSAIAVVVMMAKRLRPDSVERPIYRPFTFGQGNLLSARFANQGQTIVYGAAWNGEPVELFTVPVQRPGSTALGIGADVLGVSKQGEMALQLQPGFQDSTFGVGTLSRMFLTGSAPRDVLENVLEAEWIPDTGELAVLRQSEGRFRIEYPLGTLYYQTEGRISHFRISPDGKQIVFLLHPDPKDDAGSVAMLDESGTLHQLSTGWASTRGLAWASGDRPEIWFTAARVGTDYDLYGVDLQGNLRLVDRVAGRMVLQDIAEDGKVLLDHQIKRNGLIVGYEGKEHDLTWSDTSFLSDLSLDGRTVLFVEAGLSEGASYGAYVRPTDGGPPTRLGDGMPLALAPNGRSVLTLKHTPPISLQLLSMGTDPAQSIDVGSLSMILAARFFPNGQKMMLRAHEEGRAPRLWTYDLQTSELHPITPEGVDPSVVISSSGDRLAGIDASGALIIFSASGDRLGVVPGTFLQQKVVSWMRDENVIVMRTLSVPVQVTRVDLTSGVVTPHMTLPAGPTRPGLAAVLTLFLSADGRTYAYCDSQTLSRLYLVEGLNNLGKGNSGE